MTYPSESVALAAAPPHMEMEKELSARAEQAATLAVDLEIQAQQWRAVEAACSAALTSLRESAERSDRG